MSRPELSSEGLCQPPWAEMLPETLVKVVQLLDVRSRLAVQAVCHSWRKAALEPSCWQIVNALSWTENILPAEVEKFVNVVTKWSTGTLQELRIHHCTDAMLQMIAESSPGLQILCIPSGEVSEIGVIKVASRCTALRHLDMSRCHDVVDEEGLFAIALHCRELEILDLEEVPGVTDESIAEIASCCRKLKHVSIVNSEVGDIGLRVLADRCRELEFLDTKGCCADDLTSEGVRYVTDNAKKLKVFRLPMVPTSDAEFDLFSDGEFYSFGEIDQDLLDDLFYDDHDASLSDALHDDEDFRGDPWVDVDEVDDF